MDSVIFVKFVSALLYPIGLIVLAALLCCVFLWLNKKILSRLSLIFGVGVFLLSSNLSFATWLVTKLEAQYPQKEIVNVPKSDAILVLGGGLRMPTEPAKHVQLGAASDRYWYAVQLYNAGKSEKIILSGGNLVQRAGFESEAFYARELLIAWGVPKDVILIEEDSRTTLENKIFVQPVLKGNNVNSILLVTSAIHMPRAFGLFKSLPYQITPTSADVIVRHNNKSALSWLPSATAFNLTTVAMHEYYGLFYNNLKALIDKG